MPRRKSIPVPPNNKRIKPPGSPFDYFSPLKDKTHNNELEVKREENGFPKAQEKGGTKTEGDICKYLHKKFKKVATLEEASSPPAKGLSEEGEGVEVGSGLNQPSNETTSSSPCSPTSGGRYLCPYCKLPCAKPSVLQKHIRAHTNERPFPCHPCGFAFKTKSNLYKHCRSRAHTLKMDESDGVTLHPPNAPASYLMDSGSTSEEEELILRGGLEEHTSRRPPSAETKRILYKPKFHTSSPPFSDAESSPSKGLTLTLPPPSSFSNPSTPSPFTSGSSPSPELLHRHINKLISENQAILEPSANNHLWPKKVRQGRESPPSSVPHPKNGDSDLSKPSKLAVALLWPDHHSLDEPPPLRPDSIPLELQPLNLSTPKVDPRKRPLPPDSILKRITDLRPNLSIKFTEPHEECQRTEEFLNGSSFHHLKLSSKDLDLNITKQLEDVDMYYYKCPICQDVFRSADSLEVHFQACNDNAKKQPSPECKEVLRQVDMTQGSLGPLLGSTPLIEFTLSKEQPVCKRRKLDSSFLPRLETLAHPPKPINLCGGEVMVLDGRPLPLESGGRIKGEEGEGPQETQVLTISKTGLHSMRGTMIQTQPERTVSPKPSTHPYPEKVVLPILQTKVTSGIQGVQGGVPAPTVHLPFPPALNPLTSITAFNPLTLPPPSSTAPLTPPPGGGGSLVTILYGGKQIPFVPGIPGPNSLLANQPLIPKNPPPTHPPEKAASVIVKASPTSFSCAKQSSSVIPTIRLEGTPKEEPLSVTLLQESPIDIVGGEPLEKKFLRPSSLPLKPGTYTPKKLLPASQQVSLVSPETPRPRKSYGQLYLNGHAYTYLGLKCSTRPFYCTLNKPQPMYVPLSPDHSKVSMYSNWAICSEVNPHPLGLETRKALSYYDSRGRPSNYTIANRNKQDVITHSTYLLQKDNSLLDKSDNKENLSSDDSNPKRIKVCEGGYQSNEDYIYIRGRGFFPGRGKYVCEECGIRCKKPSMLKKHIRTHTDLRPYTCKHCAFSFKTKGNLTKHMKSKAHYKRCVELEISPVPTTVDDCLFDDDGKIKQEGASYGNGTNSEETEEETEEDEDDEDEDDSDEEGGDGGSVKLEREAAKSLLSLSEVTLETAHKQYINAGLVPASARPRTYPYTLAPTVEVPDKKSPFEKVEESSEWEREGVIVVSHSPKLSLNKALSPKAPLNPPETSTPIDLSNKASATKMSVITSAGTPTPLMATMYSSPTLEKMSGPPEEDYMDDQCKLLHAYLTERAVRDTHMKRHQVQENLKKQQAAAVLLQQQQEGPSVQTPPSPQPPEEEDPPPPLVDPPPPPPPENKPPEGLLLLTPSSTPSSESLLRKSPSKSPTRKPKAEFMPPSSGPNLTYISATEDGRSMCGVCNKVFNKPSQLRLHVNIHYFERPFRCESCAVSFRTKGHLQKHQRSLSHLNKVNMNSTFGTATSSNPRPFKCDDCKIAFRIHGHLAKHLRSKMHIMKLECLEKLPFGTYAELERSGINMNDIDTTDCENSLESLQMLAQKLYEKDPSKLSEWEPSCRSGVEVGGGGDSSEDEDVEAPEIGPEPPSSHTPLEATPNHNSLR